MQLEVAPAEGQVGQERFRDVIDVLLLRDLVEPGGLLAVRDACEEVFTLRAKHAWPPHVTVHPSWPAGFAAMAADIGFETDDVHLAADAVRRFITEITAAR